MIVVADKCINSGDNLYYTLSGKNGYIHQGEEYKYKSRLCPRQINVTMSSGRKKKVSVDEKQIVFYSDKYARRAKAERAAALLKANDLITLPCKYNLSTSYGAAKYIQNISYDNET